MSMGVLGYASTQKTIPKRKRQFSSRLHIPESFFDEFLSTQLDALKKCREEFRDCYGDELIEKFKQNGYAAMEAKIEKQNAVDKIKNEKYREENQNRYQYKEKTKMYHDLSDDYKSRDYVIAITLKEGDYYGNIFYEYSSGGYGLSVDIMEDILQFIENLDCEEINELNEEGLLNNNIALQADINGKLSLAAIASLIPVKPSAQITSTSFTPRFFSSFITESQYFALSLSPTLIVRTSFFPSVLIPRIT